MSSTYPTDPTNDPYTRPTDNGVSTARGAFDNLSSTVQDIRHQAAPLMNRAAEQVSTLAKRATDAARDSTHQLRDKAVRASDTTVTYVKDEPVKSMLIAAATGAVLMAVISMLTRRRDY